MPGTQNARRTSKAHPRRASVRRDVVVVLVLGFLLVSIGIPYLRSNRDQSRIDTCSRRQMLLGRAFLEYEDFHDQTPGYRNVQAIGADGQRQPTGWVFPLLPFLGKPLNPDAAKTMGNKNETSESGLENRSTPGPWNSLFEKHGPLGPLESRRTVPTAYISNVVCPDDPTIDLTALRAYCSFVVNCGRPDTEPTEQLPADSQANGVFLDRFQLPDKNRRPGEPGIAGESSLQYIRRLKGLSSTLMLSENIDSGLWTDYREALVGMLWKPDGEKPPILHINELAGQGDGSIPFARPSSGHSGGVNAVYCDGRTEFLINAIDPQVFRYLLISNRDAVR